MNLNPYDLPGLLERAAGYAASSSNFKDAAQLKALAGHVRRAARPTIGFVWCGGQDFEVDGTPVRVKGKGLILAWLAFAALRHRLAPLQIEWLTKGPMTPPAALNTLGRAADAVERVSPLLAGCIRCLGVHDGALVPRGGRLPAYVICRSPLLEVAAVKVA